MHAREVYVLCSFHKAAGANSSVPKGWASVTQDQDKDQDFLLLGRGLALYLDLGSRILTSLFNSHRHQLYFVITLWLSFCTQAQVY